MKMNVVNESALSKIPNFRELWDRLLPQHRTALILRCRGLSEGDIAIAISLANRTARNHLKSAVHQIAGPGDPEATIANVCWNIGYEQALQDVENQVQRKRAS